MGLQISKIYDVIRLVMFCVTSGKFIFQYYLYNDHLQQWIHQRKDGCMPIRSSSLIKYV